MIFSLSALYYSKLEGIISKAQRRYTVGYLPNGSDTPLIKLSGKWLREAGFNTGAGVTVKVAGDCIVLIPDSPQEQVLREKLAQVKGVLSQTRQDIPR
nr:SymE family type I addiction module toxin [Pluralibacter gergoviae]